MGVVDSKTLAAAKKYTDKTVAGGGAIKGKNCTVDSIISITGGHRVTFKWTLDDGTVLTNYMDVMDGVDGADGADGRGIDSVNVDANNHLIVTYDDGTDYDAGEIQVTGQTIQRNVLPTASASELGNIYQYIGATDANYTNGYFYQCVADGSNYIWENKKVQAGGGSGVDKFKDLDDVSFSSLTDGDLPQYNQTSGKWENSNQIPLGIQHLQGSMANLQIAIHNLDLLVASKVDKVPGKDLSTNDFTNDEKQKLGKLQPIYLIGSGLNLNGSVLSATGISIPIDQQLDSTSANPVQNKAIAVPVQALQGSMANVKLNVNQLAGSLGTVKLDVQHLQGSMANVYTKSEVDTIVAAIKNGRFEVVSVLPVTDIKTNVIYLVPNTTHATQNYYDEYINLDATTSGWELIGSTQIDLSNYIQKSSTSGLVKNDGSIDTQIQLDITQLQGSMANVKLSVNQLAGSMANKADKTDLDEWIGPELVDADHKVAFDNLDNAFAYKLFGDDRVVRIDGQPRKDPGTIAGTYKVTWTTDAPANTKCVLLKIKPAVPN